MSDEGGVDPQKQEALRLIFSALGQLADFLESTKDDEEAMDGAFREALNRIRNGASVMGWSEEETFDAIRVGIMNSTYLDEWNKARALSTIDVTMHYAQREGA